MVVGLGGMGWLRMLLSWTFERSANSEIALLRLDEPKGACAFRFDVVVVRLTEALFFSSLPEFF